MANPNRKVGSPAGLFCKILGVSLAKVIGLILIIASHFCQIQNQINHIKLVKIMRTEIEYIEA